MSTITRESLANNLRELGLKQGDVVLVRASLKSIGAHFKDKADYINAILDVIGPSGSLVGLSFSKSFFTPLWPPENFFLKMMSRQLPVVLPI